jgi:hypothetical protein
VCVLYISQPGAANSDVALSSAGRRASNHGFVCLSSDLYVQGRRYARRISQCTFVMLTSSPAFSS